MFIAISEGLFADISNNNLIMNDFVVQYSVLIRPNVYKEIKKNNILIDYDAESR